MRAVIISTIFTGLSILFVGLRLWTRIKLVNSPGKDDILIFAALVCPLGPGAIWLDSICARMEANRILHEGPLLTVLQVIIMRFLCIPYCWLVKSPRNMCYSNL